MSKDKGSDAAPPAQAAAEPRGVSVRVFADARKLEPWQLAALLPRVRQRVVEMKLDRAIEDINQVLPVAELEIALVEALHGRL